MSNERSLQLWPRGKMVLVRDNGQTIDVKAKREDPWRLATDDEAREVRIEEIAERLQNQDIYACQSMLVDAGLKLGGEGDMGEEFSFENVSNLRPDPSDWTFDECKQWLEDEGHDLPDPNPCAMDKDELYELLGRDAPDEDEGNAPDACLPSLGELQREAMAAIDDEEIEGIQAWRDAVNDNATEKEPYEWWLVSSHLAEKLNQIGECVMDNAYGTWWGRCTTGQALIMDGVLQKVAATML